MDSTTINLQAHLDSACRSFLRALDTGEEADLYEGLDRVLGYPCDLANSAAPTERAYYFCPQGAVSATWKMSKRDLAIAADPTYRDSDDKRGQSSNVAASQEPAADAAARRFMASDPDSLKSSQAPVRRSRRTLKQVAQPVVPRNEPVPETLSAASGISQGSSAIINVKRKRVPDFRIAMSHLADGRDLIRYDIALVEAKICSKQEILGENGDTKDYASLMQDAARGMLPQVIECVQLAFASSTQNEIAVISVVNEYCQFLYFRRSKVPKTDITKLDARGYYDGKKRIDKIAYKTTPVHSIISGVQATIEETRKDSMKVEFTSEFCENWKYLLQWAQHEKRFPKAKAAA